MDLLRCLLATRLVRIAAWVLLAGWAPLLLYVAWERATGSAGGNPIGLGLLMVAATPVAALLAAVGLAQGLRRYARGEG